MRDFFKREIENLPERWGQSWIMEDNT
jgi:hypothetical protein